MILKTAYNMKPPPSARIITRPPGLVGCWLMNERGGQKVFDVSGNGNEGILYGNAVWKDGKFGTCVKFPSDGDYLSCAVDNITSMLTQEWTCVFWTEYIDAAVWDRYIDLGGYRPFEIYFFTGGAFRLRTYIDGVEEVYYSTVGLSSGWNQVAMSGSIPNAKIRMYLNGSLTDEHAITGAIFTEAVTKTLMVGGSTASAAIHDKIDHVMLFNRALTASEIAQPYVDPFWSWRRRARPELAYVSAAPPAGIPIFRRRREAC